MAKYWVGLTILFLASNAYARKKNIIHEPWPSSPQALIWRDAASCLALVKSGQHANKSVDSIRVLTWNAHWFPDGKPGESPKTEHGVDLEWMACIFAYLQPDVIALQEVKLTGRGLAALQALTRSLKGYTGSSWKSVSDECHAPTSQHLVFLAQDNRVELSRTQRHAALDPTTRDGDPCSGRLRPGFSAYVRARKPGGVDFHLVNVHLDSGRRDQDLAHRQQAWKAMANLGSVLDKQGSDEDVVIVGDFNTMGTDNGPIKDTKSEAKVMMSLTQKFAKPLRVSSASPACSHFYKGQAHLLDYFLIAGAMAEAKDSTAHASGLCDVFGCEARVREAEAQLHLSDHCPVYLDIRNQDLDAKNSPTKLTLSR